MRKIVAQIIQLVVVPLWILIGITGPYVSLGPSLLGIGVVSIFFFVPSFIIATLGIRKLAIHKKNVAYRTFYDVTHEQRSIPESVQHFYPHSIN